MSEHVGSLLDAYLDGELSPSRMRMIEAHLESCEQCQSELEQRRQLVALLKETAPISAIRSEDRFISDIQSQLKPRVYKTWTRQRVLKVGWQAMPLGLLLTILFIRTYLWLSTAVEIIPGGSDLLLGSLPGIPIELTLSDPLQMIVEIFRIFYFPAWNWVTGIIATFIISMTYISWMVVWWSQQQSANNHRMAL